ncbi:MAG: alpha/beta fold hydrolase [Alphaproteobacteria bacterium]|nr:alpha/beta fold hydrolase [Alphaproteobacteria bacterium]
MRRLLAAIAFLLGACASPYVQSVGSEVVEPPRIAAPAAGAGFDLIASDGVRLPLRAWPATDASGDPTTPRAILIGLHGFNDYSNTFSYPGPWWARRGLTTYAYDQRGFGQAREPGRWAPVGRLTADLVDAVVAVRERHPGVPIYVVGDSMGGAVALAALADRSVDWQGLGVRGAVLAAPAVWGGATLNPLYRLVLWLAVRVIPAEVLTGRGLGIVPSDNIEMLLELGRDPLVIKGARIDAVYGLVGLMDRALAASSDVGLPLLVLYGARDEIIPRAPTAAMAANLNGITRLAVYPAGYHMVLRDLQAEVVWRDVVAWIGGPSAPLPSAAERPKQDLFGSR